MFNKKRILIGILIVSLLATGTLVLFHRTFLEYLGGRLVYDSFLEKQEQKKYAVVLCGTFPTRVLEAYELWKEGAVKKIILDSEVKPGSFDVLKEFGVVALDEQGRNMDVLNQLAVPAEDIIMMPPSQNQSTRMEAYQLKAWLEDRQQESVADVVVVTSKTHTRRAAKIFAGVFDQEIAFQPARRDDFSKATWWLERRFVKQVFFEYAKLATMSFY